jgi:uncharacterized membrane protein
MIPGSLVRRAVAALIQLDHPEWSAGDEVCLSDLHTYRLHYLQNILKSEKGELSYLDQEVVEHIRQNELIAENISDDLDQKMTRGERVADRIASFGGSWKFLGIFGATIVLWMFVNSLLLINKPFDPYPFILLNLVLSCLAAIQAPVIMMSQNRSETKDRARSEHDYQVNLKAELEIRLLHDKMDHLLLHQWQQLMEVQEIQADLMDELATKLDSRR